MSEQPLSDRNRGARERIRDFILERFPLARQSPPGDADPLLESGLVDSLGILELVNFMTDTFGIAVSDEDLQPENFNSIDSLVAFVERESD
jgi:acyl carrier protein